MKRTAKGLLFGPRRSRAHTVLPIRRGRVHHVAHVTNDPLYWQAIVFMSENQIARSADLPGPDDHNQAYQVMSDLQRWGWVDYGEVWTISEAGARAVEIHLKKQG